MNIEFDVANATAVAPAARELEQAGYELLHGARQEPWGQMVARLQAPEEPSWASPIPRCWMTEARRRRPRRVRQDQGPDAGDGGAQPISNRGCVRGLDDVRASSDAVYLVLHTAPFFEAAL
jgi:hypothetical protein